MEHQDTILFTPKFLESLTPEQWMMLWEWPGLTEDQMTQLINVMPPPEAGIGDFEVNNTEEGFEIDAFGVKLNDRDDFFTVGLVLLFAFTFYVGKKVIDLAFDLLFNRWKRDE